MFRLDAEQACLLEVLNCDDDTNREPIRTEGEIEISLHALSGTFNPRTIRMKGSIEGQ